MVGRMPSFLLVHDMMVGYVSKKTQHFLSKGYSEVQIKTARLAWICLAESIVNRGLLGRVFATKSPSAGWRALCDWFLPKSMTEQVERSAVHDAAK